MTFTRTGQAAGMMPRSASMLSAASRRPPAAPPQRSPGRVCTTRFCNRPTALMDYASSLTDSAEYGTVRTFSGDLISEASGTLTSAVCASRADRAVSCSFDGLRLDLRSVFVLDSVTDIYFSFDRDGCMSAVRISVRHLSYLRMPKRSEERRVGKG